MLTKIKLFLNNLIKFLLTYECKTESSINKINTNKIIFFNVKILINFEKLIIYNFESIEIKNSY